jgi:vacuolar-type H+-ATPase subunit F/Vma7
VFTLKEAQIDNPLAIVGEEDIVSGFQALGFKVYTDLNAALADKPAICLVQDEIYRQSEDLISSYRQAAIPAFIPFGKNAEMSLLEKIVRDIRLRATGTF